MTKAWSSRYHLFADDPFELPEIHDHAQLGIPSVADRNASHGHEQPVRMAVYFAARTVVTFEQVRRLERELLGKSYLRHTFILFHDEAGRNDASFRPVGSCFTPNGRRNVRSELPSVLLRSIVEAIDVNLTLEPSFSEM